MTGPRICFLFNHDQIHQVAHSLPIALSLADGVENAEVVLATTSPRLSDEVRRIAGPSVGTSVELVELDLQRPSSKLLNALAGRVLPARKLLIYRDNLDFFRSFDLLVVTEKTSLILKSRYKLEKLRMVHTRHGAGDRAIGFNKASGQFDHVLVAGPKIKRRLIDDAGVPEERISVVGYPKFDLAKSERWQPTFPNPVRPTVIYNPHVSPHLSSWFDMGLDVLDWFADHPEYNLIFAPHIMLFERSVVVTIDKLRVARMRSFPERIREAPNIHIDLGSRLSTNMAYMNSADIYLGDVSSQVYEFLIRPRPCVFLNPRGIAWQDDPNFASWAAGPVIERIDQLGGALVDAQRNETGAYRAIQQKLVDETFDLTDVPSSVRAARAIARFAGLPFSDA